VFLFLLGFVSARTLALGRLCNHRNRLLGFFALHPLPGEDFNYPAVGVPADWPHHYDGFMAHWNKNSNAAWAFDTCS